MSTAKRAEVGRARQLHRPNPLEVVTAAQSQRFFKVDSLRRSFATIAKETNLFKLLNSQGDEINNTDRSATNTIKLPQFGRGRKLHDFEGQPKK